MERQEYRNMYEEEDAHWWYRGLRLHLAGLIGPLRGKRVLDAGCGTGANAIMLSERSDQVYGFDFSPEAISFCKQKGVTGVFAADVNHIPFKDESFDFVLCCNLFEHS